MKQNYPLSPALSVYSTRIWRTDYPEQDTGSLAQYDYIYLGDNARSPYGTRSFEIVYEFTLQAVTRIVRNGMPSRYPGMQYGVRQGITQHTNERSSRKWILHVAYWASSVLLWNVSGILPIVAM